MSVFRIPTESLRVFQSFDGYRTPEFLDIQTQSSNPVLLEDLPHLGLAIVGTRHPQKRSLALLESAIERLQGSGLLIISGFARGIDSAAHELALKYGLKTIAILGCGIDVDYPRENLRLREAILHGEGMILSPFDRGTPPLPHFFHYRNGLIAGFSSAVWVVEAAAVSGTLNTASWAQKFNRDLYATSCFPGDPFFQGNQKLLSQYQTDRFPIASPFFGPESLSSTWPSLILESKGQLSLELKKKSLAPLSRLQRIILSIQSELGICYEQTLLQFDVDQGIAPSQHFHELEMEIRDRRILRRADGSVESIP